MQPTDLKQVLATLGRPRVLVVGDLILDHYVTGDVERISPEAPIPILAARTSDERLGGAGNVAANLRSMEAEVEVVGVVGPDRRGERLRGLLERIGADASGCLVDPARPTIEKTRFIAGGNQLLRVDREKKLPIEAALAERILAELPRRIARAQAVVLSDYDKGLLTQALLRGVIDAARAARVPVLVDPKGADYSIYRGATLVTPNRKEAELALGRRLDALELLPQAARDLIAVAELQAAVITLGAEGMFHLTRGGESVRVPTVARAVFDVTGAGDTVIAHLALGLACGLPLATAVLLSNQAAGIVVGRRGAASVTREDLLGTLGERELTHKVIPAADLDLLLAGWRADGQRIVFTNGCFDVLHAGHVNYLRFARSKGDRLLVGVNDDASTHRLKGPGRPVNCLADRMEVLAALEMVDGVTSFAEDTPREIIERITPDVLVKGEDWRDKGVVGREWVEAHGGVVHLAPLLAGRSTSAILEKGRTANPPRPG
jgi:D-beta-D-heptose 7-phosphate kinase/D-beta-D-heptose 1-phosphate adenosyltransferase